MATISRIEGMQLADLKARAKIKILETDVNALKQTYTNDQVDKLVEDLKTELTTGPDAPYTKAEVDAKVDTVQKAIDAQYGNDVIDKKIKEAKDEVVAKIDAGYSNDQIDAKINKVNQDLSTTINAMYTNAQIDKKINDAVDGLAPGGTGGYGYSRAEIDTKFTEVNKSIVDKLDGYVKTTDLNANYYTKDQVYTKTEIETDYYKKEELLNKTEIETNYINKTDAYTKTETDNKIDEKIDTKVGDLETLTTTEKTNLVGALNEVKDGFDTKLDKPTVDGTQGQVLSIDTDGNIVWSNSAFNADAYYNKEQSDNRYYTKTETDNKIKVVSNSVGDITGLKTTKKDSTVEAINELKTSIDNKMNNPTTAGLENQVLTIGNDGNPVWKNSNFNPDLYYDKTTTDKTINNLKTELNTKLTKPTVDGTQGQILAVSDDGSLFWKDFNLDNIDMTEYCKKTEADAKIKEKTGDLAALTTTAKDNLVLAINELKTSNDDIPSKFSTENTDTKFDIKYDNNSIASIDLLLDDNTVSGEDGTFNIDLTPYQTKEDTSLPTTNKTISGAIKEIYNRDTMMIKAVLVDDDTGAVVDDNLTIEVKLS